MRAATRLLIAFVFLVAAFLVLIGFAAFSLVSAGQHALAALVGVAGLAGAAAGGVTYWLLRRDADTLEDEMEELVVQRTAGRAQHAAAGQPVAPSGPAALSPLPRTVPQMPRMPRRPIRVQSMPVADLPPAYVDAVLRGAQARLSALKDQQH